MGKRQFIHLYEQMNNAEHGTLYLGMVLSNSETGTSVPTTPSKIPRFLWKHTKNCIWKVTYITSCLKDHSLLQAQ